MQVVNKTPKLLKSAVYENDSIVRWPITEFVSHARDDRKCLDSELFSLDGLSSKFFLRVYPSHLYNGVVDYHIRIDEIGGEKEIECTVSFWLENIIGEKCVKTQTDTFKFVKNCDHHGFCDVSNCDGIISKADFFKDDTAIVCCEIVYQSPLDSETSLRRKLWNSYKNGLCDLVTIKVEDSEFKVSKMILVAHSNVFKRMFSTPNCKETQTGIIEIKDFKAPIIEALIQFMHIEEVDNLEPNAIDLFKVADKYNVEGLKDMCAKVIANTLSGEMFFEIVVLAYMYRCNHLKVSISDFLIANPKGGNFTKLISMGEWQEFACENKELAAEIVTDLFQKMNIYY